MFDGCNVKNLMVIFRQGQQSPHLIIPRNGPINRSPANQFMNPARAPDLLWIWPLPLGKADKSGPRARCEPARFWDDEVGPLLKWSSSASRACLTEIGKNAPPPDAMLAPSLLVHETTELLH